MSLDRVKLVLAAAAGVLNGLGIGMGRVGPQVAESTSQLRAIYENLGRDLMTVTNVINDLREQKQMVIAATAGHQVSAPANGLAAIDMALLEAERLWTKLLLVRARVEEALAATTGTQDMADATGQHSRRAGDIFDRYRGSF